MIAHRTSKTRNTGPALHSMSGVLSVIQPRMDDRGTLEGHARQMVAAQMALAMRDNPPAALQLALMEVYQRGRKIR